MFFTLAAIISEDITKRDPVIFFPHKLFRSNNSENTRDSIQLWEGLWFAIALVSWSIKGGLQHDKQELHARDPVRTNSHVLSKRRIVGYKILTAPWLWTQPITILPKTIVRVSTNIKQVLGNRLQTYFRGINSESEVQEWKKKFTIFENKAIK